MDLILSFLLQLIGISCEPTGATVRLVPWTEEGPTQHLAGVSGNSMQGQSQLQCMVRPLKQKQAWM